MAQVTGIINITIDGAKMRTKENSATLDFGGESRSPITGNGRLHGFANKFMATKLEATLIHMGDTDVETINSYTDVTVQVETDTGITYQIAHAFVTEPCQLKEGEGELTLKMAGDKVTEI